MSTIQRNKETIQKLYEDAFNKRDMALLQNLIAEDYVGQSGRKGAAAFEEPINALINGLPDVQWKIETLVAEGDKVVVTWKVLGTHTGRFSNFAPTGKTASSGGMAIYQLEEGKIIKAEVLTDRLGFLQQLEILPDDLTLLSNRKARKEQVNFIDKFLVPSTAIKAFYERMSINRSFIKTLPGFIEDTVYAYTDNEGNLICITVALWENKEVLEKAREAVQAAYKRQGFDSTEMFKRLNITVDRGVYSELGDQ